MKIFIFYNLEDEKNSFVEPLDFLSDNYERSRRTKRLEKYILDVSNLGSSISAEKTLKRNGVKISDTSINRMIKKKRAQ